MINVIIPAYNCQATLGRTLASLVAQTDTNFEVIIVDDCSTEDIKSIIDDYSTKLKIIYFRNKENLGVGYSRQVGIDNATQKFITFLDSDDMFLPYTVETFNSTIEANPNIEYLHSYFYEQIVIDNNPAIYLWKDNYTACHGKLYNVDLIKKYNIRIPTHLRLAEDTYFNAICSELMEMSIIKVPTMFWSNNPNSIMRRYNPERNAIAADQFLDAMIMSTEFVLQYKDHVDHLQNTINRVTKEVSFNEKETKKLNKLLKYIGGNQ